MGKFQGKVAEKYLEFVDGSLTFTEEELDGYDPQKLAEQRIAWLCTQHKILMRRSQLPATTYPVWWKDARARLRSVLGWYPKGMTLVRVTDEDMGMDIATLPSLTSKAGKQLTLEASALDNHESEWLDAWVVEAYKAAHYATSIVYQLEYWTKAKNSLNNKFMNCIVGHELRVIGDLRETLASRLEEI